MRLVLLFAALICVGAGCQTSAPQQVFDSHGNPVYFDAQGQPYWVDADGQGWYYDCPDGNCPVQAWKDTWATFVDVPPELRQRNWTDRNGQGSCVWASLTVALRMAGRDDAAVRVMRRAAGPANLARLVDFTQEKLGIEWLATADGDLELLNMADQNGQLAVIWYDHKHAQNFLGWDAVGNAVLLDNNHPNEQYAVDRETFIYNWRTRYGGIAMIPHIPGVALTRT